jgi:hypothetical protein
MRECEPWTIHSDLTRDRLIEIGRLIRQGRNDALDRFDASIGDDAWTLGCCAFQFQRHRILMACVDDRFTWLSVIDSSKQFVFGVGAVPMRFYRGAADDPSERTLRQSYPELRQLSLFPDDIEAREYAHRLAIETDLDGAITGIKYVAMSGDTPKFFWDIPLIGTVAPIRPIAGDPAPGVHLPAPEVELADEDQDKTKKR